LIFEGTIYKDGETDVFVFAYDPVTIQVNSNEATPTTGSFISRGKEGFFIETRARSEIDKHRLEYADQHHKLKFADKVIEGNDGWFKKNRLVLNNHKFLTQAF